MKTLSTEVSANDIGSFAEIIEKYGAGVLAIAVLAVLFIFIIKYLKTAFRNLVIGFNLKHYEFSSSNFFINSTNFSTPSIGIAL